MDGEEGGIMEYRLKDMCCVLGFDGAMEFANKIGGGDMKFAIEAIVAWGNGSGICGPHIGSG